VSLRISGDNLEPSEVTAELGLRPDVTGRRGEHIRGNARYAVYETGIWVHSYEEGSLVFEDRLDAFISTLEARAEAVRALTTRAGVGAELFLGFSAGNGQGGFTLSASLLGRIAALGLDLTLDLYPPTVDTA
jgi:hypothetical protein